MSVHWSSCGASLPSVSDMRLVNAIVFGGSPCRELISRLLKTITCPISGVDLGMHHVGICKCHSDKVVNVGRKASETRLIAHEAMDVHE